MTADMRSSLMRCALASFPRSGNTWVRYMIEEVTGLQSGSIYDDRVLPRGRNGIIIKTHALDSFNYDSAVHIVRNPYDAISSYYHWREDIAGEAGLDWDKHALEAAAAWEAHCLHWLKAPYPVCRIRYEDLVSDATNVLVTVIEWLGQTASRERIQEVVRQATIENMRKLTPLGKRFFRGASSSGRQAYSPQVLTSLCERLHDLLLMFGYQPL